MTFESWADAKAALDVVYALQKEWGMYAGRLVLQREGEVHSQAVLDQMRLLGALTGYYGKYHWIGSVITDLVKEQDLVDSGREFRHTRGLSHQRVNPIWERRIRTAPFAVGDAPDCDLSYSGFTPDVYSREQFLLGRCRKALKGLEGKLRVSDYGDLLDLRADLEQYASDHKGKEGNLGPTDTD